MSHLNSKFHEFYGNKLFNLLAQIFEAFWVVYKRYRKQGGGGVIQTQYLAIER